MAAKTYRHSIDAEQLRAVLDYNPYTGIFRWRYRREMANSWNVKYTGQIAGASGSGYVLIIINNVGYKAHRLAWLYMTDEWPADIVDHIDGNGVNNVWGNLRQASHSQNTANAKLWRHNTSGFRGVFWRPERKTWLAKIHHKGTVRYLGSFATPAEANQAYLRAATAINGSYVRQASNSDSEPEEDS
jgi:hypothetical protein